MKVKRSKSLSPEPSGSHEFKRSKIDDEDAVQEAKTVEPNLLDFSDDVLLNIMKYLHPQDLLALSSCCQRFDRVCRDRTLWRIIDCRAYPMAMEDLERYKKFLQPTTTCVAVRGSLETKGSPVFKKDFLSAVSDTCVNLKELVIEECNIDGQDIKMADFPASIQKLSLKGCAVQNLYRNKSYFFKIDHHLRYLTCLILSHCEWFTSHSLLVISKMPKLLELRLDSCRRIGECVAYASLATRFGFKSLQILDVRNTALGDSEICCFSSTKTLTHMYLECPPLAEDVDLHGRRRHSRLPDIGGVQIFEDRILVQYLLDDDSRTIFVQRCMLSDRAVCALGTHVCDRRVIDVQDVIFVEQDIRVCNNPMLKVLVVRHYTRVTNQSLEHLAVSAPSLELLDVTGTSVTEDGVLKFKRSRPNVKILSSFDSE